MPEHNEPNNQPHNSNKNNNRAANNALRWIVGGGAVFFASLILVTFYHPNLEERVKFFTANFLSLAVLIVVVLQSVIYREQMKAMHEQGKAMRDSVKAAKESIGIARKHMVFAQRAYVTIPTGKIVGRSIEQRMGMYSEHAGLYRWFKFDIVNSGNTPANNVEILSAIDVLEQPPAQDANLPNRENLGVIAPHSPKDFATITIAIRDPEFTDWKEGRRKLYC